MTNLKTTPLTGVHQALGAKMVDFAGYLMPVAYGSIIEEHQAVRERVGLFDVSHMGEFLVRGRGARDLVNEIVTNDVSKLERGGVQYTVMCRENGTVVDDLLVFVVDDERLILVVNASNIDKDFAHVSQFKKTGAEIENASDRYALLAVQGPRSRDVLLACPLFRNVRGPVSDVPYYKGFSFEHEGEEILVTRTGYTGELGFEVFVPPRHAKTFWEEVMKAGETFGIRPIGLGARDTLRFEASYCLYGHELDDETSPLEAGLGWVVKLGKSRFRGLDTLKREKEKGSKRTLVGFELEGRNIARQGYDVLRDGKNVGKVTSGAFSPSLEKSLCMALIDSAARDAEAAYEARIRDKVVAARVTPLPFYKSRAK